MNTGTIAPPMRPIAPLPPPGMFGAPAASPLSRGISGFIYKIDETTKLTPMQRAIIDSGKPIESLSQDELREVYFLIGGGINERVYTATTLNHIESDGEWPTWNSGKTESTFIGDQIHKAMETKGVSLQELHTFGSNLAPVKPETSLNKDHLEMIKCRVEGHSASVAYMMVKDNLSTKATSIEDIMTLEAEPVTATEKPKDANKVTAAANKVINAAKKEAEKYESEIPVFTEYFRKLAKFEEYKTSVRKKGGIIIDDVECVKSSADRVMVKIKASFAALDRDPTIHEIYHTLTPENDGSIESYSEFIVLWKYTTKEGKVVLCRSMFDRIHIDFKRKACVILDIKSHSKPARDFVNTNYFNYAYYRSMAFYREAAIQYLISRGVAENEARTDWNHQSILLPVSTISFETGCYVPYLFISKADIDMGTTGSYVAPLGTRFNMDRHVQWALDGTKFNKLKDLGLIHENAFEYYIKGWRQVLETWEMKANMLPSVPGV
jgi:hypothetical protein